MSQVAANADAVLCAPLPAAALQTYSFRALIIDPDPDAREFTSRALERENIQCHAVANGEDALQRLEQHTYDLLVTELRLPRRSGHSLAVEVLARRDRPLVVIVSGVSDPRLARDLYTRGASDFIHKPLKYDQLGPRLLRILQESPRAAATTAQADDATAGKGVPQITPLHLEARVEKLERLMPISQAALEVVRMVHSTTCDSRRVAAAIALDPTLAVEVLRLANSDYYNPTGQKLVDVDEAVVRIGHRRIGELACIASDMPILDHRQIPWMHVALAWQRSLAAGIACERLAEALQIPAPQENTFLGSLLHGMGRIVLATLFPAEYQAAVAYCQRQGLALATCEAGFLPETPSACLARLFKRWGLPDEVCEPLQFVDNSYDALAELNDELRSQVEVIKLSALLGTLAIGHWETWDQLELPPATVTERLGLEETAIREILQHARRDLASLSDLFTLQSPDDSFLRGLRGARCAYQGAAHSFDWMREILTTLGLQLCEPGQEESASLPLILNDIEEGSFEVRPHAAEFHSAESQASQPQAALTLAGAARQEMASAAAGQTLAFPASLQQLTDACRRMFSPQV